jgi:hypothetical protein
MCRRSARQSRTKENPQVRDRSGEIGGRNGDTKALDLSVDRLMCVTRRE